MEDRLPPQGKARLAGAGEAVVSLYDSWGKPDKAAEWRVKLGPKR